MHVEIFHCLVTKLHKTQKSKAKQEMRNTEPSLNFKWISVLAFFQFSWHAYRAQPKQRRMSEKAMVDHNHTLFPLLTATLNAFKSDNCNYCSGDQQQVASELWRAQSSQPQALIKHIRSPLDNADATLQHVLTPTCFLWNVFLKQLI